MKKTTLLLLIVFLSSCTLFSNSLFPQELPHYMTEAEKELLKTYQYPTTNQRDNNPPPTPVRTMAEWEECQGFVIKWTQFIPILTEIVRYGCQEGLVFILTTDSNSVKTTLSNASIPLTNIRFPRGFTTGNNTIWARDYGPWAVYSGVADSLKLIDWIYNRPRPGDDTNSVTIGQLLNVPVHRTLIAPNDLVNTGGNFMVDGNGTGFASKLIISENAAGNPYGVSTKTEGQINSIMNTWMGINRYIKMETLPYDEIHHIDMHIKLLDEETLLVSQYPAGVADGPQIEANLQYVLNNFQTCYGKPYKVVRIPAPPAANGLYPNNGGDYRTYTNSLIINKTILVPIYASSYDTTALRIYRETMPGYKVYGINCNAIIPSLGAIHCITKEIGVKEPIFFSHSAIRNTTDQGPQFIKSYIKTRTGVSSVSLYWRTDTTAAYSQIPMTAAGADTFTATIPGQIYGKTVYYYLSANSNSGRTVTKPLTAPQGYIKYRVQQPVGISGNTLEVTSYSLKQNYPNPFNPETKINYTLPKSEYVTLKVYDINGKEVASLVNSYQTSGSYNYTFDGSRLASGVYFYRILAGSFSEYRSMILLK
jgi:agmatine/peptidylarginine deiminase